MVVGAIPGYLAILGGLYTFLTSKGRQWVRGFLGVADLGTQHEAQARRLDTVATELRALKVVTAAQNKTINGLSRILVNVNGIDSEEVPFIKEGNASEAMYESTRYSTDDFIGSGPSDD